MSVSAARPRVADLVFQVYGKPLHPELFQILAEQTFCQRDYELRLRITRAGHVLTWQNGEVLITELADTHQDLFTERRRLLSYKMRGEHVGSLRCAHGIYYQMNFQVETLEPEIFHHVNREIIADGAKRGLLHNFEPSHRLSIPPLGYVAMESRRDCLIVSTFHTFPDEYTIVKSQSLIEWK